MELRFGTPPLGLVDDDLEAGVLGLPSFEVADRELLDKANGKRPLCHLFEPSAAPEAPLLGNL